MSQWISTKACPKLPLSWHFHKLTQVFAGRECVMALTAAGQVLQQVSQPSLEEDLSSWTKIRQIAISQCFPALAVGLQEDGTCRITRKALEHCAEVTGVKVSSVCKAVNDLKDICQVCISDSIFALDRSGRVHYIPLFHDPDYPTVTRWNSIRRLIVGNQNAVFGITYEGTVVCAGGNCLHGAAGDLSRQLSQYGEVVDLCPLGAECSRVILALKDGTVTEAVSAELPTITHSGKAGVCQGNFCMAVIQTREETLATIPYSFPDPENLPQFQATPVTSVAVGNNERDEAFIIALKK